MKIICGERVLDLDRMNSIMPDGEHVWAEVQPFTYSPARLPEGDRGSYLLTPDQGAIAFRDLAFKILVDMGAWAGAGCVKYLMRDIARGAAKDGSGWDRAALPDAGAGKILRSALGLKSVYMPCPDGILESNLGALFDGACDLDGAVFGLLSEYIYISEGAAFSAVHDSLSKLLASFGPDDFAMFVDGIYGVVSSDPDDVKARLAPEPVPEPEPDAPEESRGDAVQQEQEAVPAPVPEDVQQEAPGQDAPEMSAPEPEKKLDMDALCNASVRDLPRRPLLPGGTGLFSSGRKLKGSDLTGTDETYSMEYYAGFYRDAMEKADSTGFADQLIRARAGHGTAPIAILEEAVNKFKTAVESQQTGKGQAANLRGMLLDMAGTLMEATGKLESLPEPKPEPDAPVSEPVPVPAAEQGAPPVPQETGAVPGPEPARAEPAPEPAPEEPVPAGPVSEPVPAEPEQEPEYDIPDYGDENYDENGDEDGPPDEGDGEPPDGDF